MLIDAERSLLLVVDLQAKMVPAVADGDAIVASAAWLIRVAPRIAVPVAAVEQHPKGLGPLVPAIRRPRPDARLSAGARASLSGGAR